MNAKSLADKLQQTLLKMAQGFYYHETVDEYVLQKNSDADVDAAEQLSLLSAVVDDKSKILTLPVSNMQLAKRKISSHFVPPDMLAIKLLLDQSSQSGDYSKLSDEELLALKNKLINELVKEEK